MDERWAAREFAGADVADKRYLDNLAVIADRLASSSESSFTRAVGHDGRQAARRVFKNERTTVDGLLAGHYEQSALRAGDYGYVLAVQDTTTFDYTSHPATRGLGNIATGRQQGLLAHSVLLVSPQGLPLGLVAVDLWTRNPDERGKKHTRRNLSTAEKESRKWTDGLNAVTKNLPSKQKVVLVQDRESDVFEFLAAPRRACVELLVRASHARNVEWSETDEQGGVRQSDLLSAAESAPELGYMSVAVPRKPGQASRTARLLLRARTLRICRPKGRKLQTDEPWVEYTIVCAIEQDVPEGIKPIHWVLITTLPVTSEEQAHQAVTMYSQRWIIERLHHTLKTGLRVERLQLNDAHNLMNAIALYYVVAWRLLWLSHLARTQPDLPARDVMAEDELTVLQAAAGKTLATVAEAVLAIAKLGGYVFYKTAPPPGAQSLWLGLRRLEAMTDGWNLGRALGWKPPDPNPD